MSFALRAALSAALLIAAAPPTLAQSAPRTDPEWPCPQIKTTSFSLASVWSGPDVEVKSNAWRDDPEVADLVAAMSQRRVPIADVEKAIAAFKAKGGADANARLLSAFGAAFDELTQQRSEIIDGLTRFGRKQLKMADRIREENEAVQKAADAAPAGATSNSEALQRLQWDIRVFEDRRRTVSYVCEVPALIEQRIGAIARAVQSAL